MSDTAYKHLILVFGMVFISILSSCKRGSESLSIPSVKQDSSAPVQLGGQRGAPSNQEGPSIRVQLDRAKVVRSIENYRVNKNAPTGSYKYVGADLNGDGQAEVIVYLTGRGWCARTGCTLAILSPVNKYSYESVSTIRRVKKPVTISSERTNGWLDLHIRTGLADWPKSHKVVLKFDGSRYPGNAVLLSPLSRSYEVKGDEIFPPATEEEREYIKTYTSSN